MGLMHWVKPKYKVGDRVAIKSGHSLGCFVTIEEVLWDGYKVYIPYWDFFTMRDEDILESVGNIHGQIDHKRAEELDKQYWDRITKEVSEYEKD